LQPLTVTRKEIHREDGTFYSEYELIAGERRLRASKLAGLSQVPVIIRSGEQTDQEKLELSIIENLQREDLDAVDRAIAFRQLADQFKMSHAQVAKKVGRSREYVSNTLRLLQLPDYMLNAIKGGDMSEGHGRTLLMLSDRPEEQDTVFRETILKKLSVREVERISRKIATDKVRKKDWGIDPILLEIEKRFTDTLGTRVQIMKTDFGGKLTIDYFTNDDLEKLLDIVERQEAQMVEAVADMETEMQEKLESDTPLSFGNSNIDELVNEESETVTNNDVNDPEEVTLGGEETPSPDFSRFLNNESLPPEPAAPTEPKQEETDETDLYSLRNFNF